MRFDVLEERQLLATITVNTTADDTSPDSTLSLREAIEVSDGTLAVSSLSTQQQAEVRGAVASTNTIDFNIPTSDPGYNATTGVWTFAWQTVKGTPPTISTNAAIIDGYSQPGASKNTLAQGDNAKLVIAINGESHGSLNGLSIAQPGSKLLGLDIENFAGDGLLITAGGNVQVAGCFIGTDPAGETKAQNLYGVVIENSSNMIGGPGVGDRNVISGSYFDGVYVPDSASNPLKLTPTENLVENNYIGLDATGTKAINNGTGVNDNGSGDTYGGTTAGVGNVVSGNGDGLTATGSVTIEGNYCGTDATGSVAIGNSYSGIKDMAVNTTPISSFISNNLVSGNRVVGIEVSSNAQAAAVPRTPQSPSAFTISDNLIGTNAAGTAALGNVYGGLQLYLTENATVRNNVISGNTSDGILVEGDQNPQHNVFQGNLIGTDRTGLVAIGNGRWGIELTACYDETIGGAGPNQGNVIAHNGNVGIESNGGGQQLISRNSIFDNAQGGMQITPFLSSQFVNPPKLSFTPEPGGTGTLSGTLNDSPNTPYVIEIFSNPTAPAVRQEQGQTFVQAVTVNTDGSGNGTFSVPEQAAYYTATATDPSPSTSKFSNATGTAALPATTTVVSSSANPSTFGQAVTFTAVVSAQTFQGTPTGTVTFTVDGQPQSPIPLAVVGGVDEARFTTSTLAAGQHPIQAAYSGDANVSASSGSLPTQTVSVPNLHATTTTLKSSLNPSEVGQSVTFTAVVSAPGFAGAPTGTVTFTIDGQAQTPVALSVVGGVDEARFTTSTLAVGRHSIEAAYSGDANLSASSGSLPTQTANAPNLHATTTTLESSVNPSEVGQSMTFTAVVSAANAAGTPTGMVTFVIDGASQTPIALNVVGGNDEATFSTSNLTAGQHTISAMFQGDSTFAASTVSTPLTEVVNNPAGRAPAVVSVKRYGYHRMPTVVVVAFSADLDPTKAQDCSNYVINTPAGRRIAVESAVYDSTARTVTLKPRERVDIHYVYRFAIIGTGPNGVTGADGTPLDPSADGAPGADFVTTLTWKNLVLTSPGTTKNVSPRSAHPAGVLSHRFVAMSR